MNIRKGNRSATTGEQLDMVLFEGGKEYPFVFGTADPETEKMIAHENEGFTLKSGETQTPSGHRFHALVSLNANSSYENWGVLLAYKDEGGLRIIEQDSDEFERWRERAEREMEGFEFYPYRYIYYDQSDAQRDHHVGDDGWSAV